MSFFDDVRTEFCGDKHIRKNCCAGAFLYGASLFSAHFSPQKIIIRTENETFHQRILHLTKRFYPNVVPEASQSFHGGRTVYIVTFLGEDALELYEDSTAFVENSSGTKSLSKCCGASFLRGGFCAGGFIGDPERSYHMELVTADENLARFTLSLIASYGLTPRLSTRRGAYVVYIKDSEMIFSLLNYLGAPSSSLRLMEEKVIKEVRNDVNRKVNFETANLLKTASAAAEQIQAIELILEKRGIAWLPEHLRELCAIRYDNPHMPLSRLGQMLSPPLSRSGVNHRLRKIVELSKEIRA